ncbi:dimethylarginine dimethylaminohydrolase family protein [Oceanobacillus sojae]|uniref:dimethylarginine dimethylaminohydrolase family protein n=1 Tax=Oceanobacillus sojae TaxID=582851 RepID=UPI0009883925|nr:arginine deiminase family protein [Oceanobacillus sojae]
MIKDIKEKYTIHCQNEYDPLQQVIVAPPDYMKITTVINETQSHYAKENINISKATKQHHFFVETLEYHGAEVISLSTKPDLNEQVFTRDIGFTLHDRLFAANMDRDIRKEETRILKNWLHEEQLDYTSFINTSIEGGDVIIDNDQIWVGLSQRTKQAAVDYLREQFPHLQITAIPLRSDILHLDCVFNILEGKHALIYPDGLSKSAYQILSEQYTLVEVTKEEQFSMAPNILSIGDKKVISLPENKRVNNTLKELGYHTIEVPFSEIIKSGGSFRCCTLPLYRRKS